MRGSLQISLLLGLVSAQFGDFSSLFGNAGSGLQMQNQQPQQGFNLGNMGNGGIQMQQQNPQQGRNKRTILQKRVLPNTRYISNT